MAVKAQRREAESSSPAQPVESVRRALRILRSFTPDRPEIGVSEIARALDIHKSTVHRLLGTLESEGFVRQIEDGRYALTWQLFEMASRFPTSERLHRLVFDALSGLARATGETAHLAVLDHEQVLYVDKVEGSRALRMPSAAGLRLPVHCTALGKVLLAGLPREQAWRIVSSRELEPRTPHTLTDPALVIKAVERAGNDGYAIDYEEIEDGLVCIAAPVRDDHGMTHAAVSIAGPVARMSVRLVDTIDRVRSAAGSLSDVLGPDAARIAAGTYTRRRHER